MQTLAPSRSRRDLLLLFIAAGLALVLLAAVGQRLRAETGGSNSYALIAQSFLTGTPDVDRCFDVDCAVRGGKTYVVFPPFPGVVAMPLVRAYGVETTGFVAISTVSLLLSLLLWWRILAVAGTDREMRIWVLLAIALASPLFYVTLRGDRVWFYAQAIAFPLVSLALHEAQAKRMLSAGVAIGCAFLCRQMSIFYTPILLVMTFAASDALLKLDRARVWRGLLLGGPVAFALLAYFSYNYWRFGNPLDTGYNDIAFGPGMLLDRSSEFGLWNKAYIVFNAFYLFLQGFHAEFADPQKIRLAGLDNNGTAILSASPWLLFLYFTPLRRVTIFCGLLIIGLSAITLFYHSNGFSQFNTQRYTLDWLPAALLMLSLGLRREHLPTFRLLVVWGIALNVATVAVLALTKSP
jgi:hypothetical protein